MTESNVLTSEIIIKLDGQQIQDQIVRQLLDLTVDQSTNLPDLFTLLFRDPEMKLIDEGPFDLTKQIEIEAKDESGTTSSLMKGEITALEPRFREGMLTDLMVRGYDKSHRMHRQTKSRSFQTMQDSELAQKIGGEYGLSTEVDKTSTVYDHIYQHNQTDYAFLAERAWRIGYEFFVDQEKLFFRKPKSGGATVTLTYGTNLRSFHPNMTLAEQVDEVDVRGWDPKEQKAIVGKAKTGQLYAAVGESKNGASWASTFGTGKKVIVDHPVTSQAEANVLAAARLDEISGAFIQAEGVAFRQPAIRAGNKVKLEGVGRRFSGDYLVTSAVHHYNSSGLETTFNMRGTRTGLLAEQISHQPPVDRWDGIVPAVVTNTEDPEALGRVKVKFPWMTDDAESDWARVISAGAGPEAGFFVVPEVNDEVMVAFEHGEFNQPYVLGGVWNGKHKIPPPGEGAAANEKPLVRTWYSRTGHQISMHDDADKKIEIKTAGGHSILMDDNKEVIELTASNNVKLVIDKTGNVDLTGGSNVTIEASGNMEFKSNGNMNLTATGNFTAKGIQATLEGTAMATVKAPTVSISGSALTEVKGALVKIN